MKISEHWKLVPREASDAVLECLYEDSQEAWAYLLNTTPSAPTEAMERVVEALGALGVIGNGYCFCSHDRDPDKAEHQSECRDAREALAALEKAMEKDDG